MTGVELLEQMQKEIAYWYDDDELEWAALLDGCVLLTREEVEQVRQAVEYFELGYPATELLRALEALALLEPKP